MSTPAQLPGDRNYPAWLLQLISLFVKYQSKTKDGPGSGWFDKTAWQDHVAYPQNPVRSAAELKKLILSMRSALPKVNVPVLLVHSRDETYVAPENLETIYAGLVNTSDKTRLYVTGSGHVVSRDASREQVFKATAEFIQRVSKQK